jgi:hypothetical protein
VIGAIVVVFLSFSRASTIFSLPEAKDALIRTAIVSSCATLLFFQIKKKHIEKW